MSPRGLLKLPSRRALRSAAVVVLAAVVGLLGAWLAMRTFSRSTVGMGPFRVRLEAGFGRGVTEIALPPLGRVQADTHVAPLRLTATLEDVGVSELSERFAGVATREIVREVEADALERLRPFALRVLLLGVLGAGVAGVLVFRRRVGLAAVAVLAALVVVGGSEAAAWVSFRPAAFLSPSFTGSLELAPKLLGPVRQATDRIDDFRAELERIVLGALRAYGSVRASALGAGDEIRVLHVSDIHLSPLGLEFTRQLAEGFDVDFVVDTGDLTSFGTPLEEVVLSRVEAVGRPYVFVRGNHDSPALARALARLPNGRVLDGETRGVRGVRVYGLGHPAFTADRRTALDDPAFEALARSAAAQVSRDLAELDEPPDIVAVHDDRMVESLAGAFPLVISGHFHDTDARVIEGTLFLRVGTTGGAGFTVFTREGGIPLSALVLSFERSDPSRLVAYDVITQSPETGDFTVERHNLSVEAPDGPLPGPSPTPRAPAP